VDILEALNIQREFGLLTNDALLLAVARRLNCSAIATADAAFQSVTGFAIYVPEDVG
jgi:predicted nucleic acid-binding protein